MLTIISGGGTAGATRSILSIPQLGFNSYTFTDISPSFFEKARQEFTAHQDRMEFQKLDISQSPEAQGFKAHSYDLVLASSVLHATPNLDETMKNVRYLLRPGGYAVILEATHKDHTRVGYLFGLFPDWWAGCNEGRVLDPFATIDEWDAIFKRTGFSGVECRTLDRDGHIFPNSLFITRAVTPKVSRLYEPLTAPPAPQTSAPLVVVGGKTSKSSRILEVVNSILPHRKLLLVGSLRDIRDMTFENKPTFLVLSEFDEELFSEIDEAKLESVKLMLAQASNVLWVTENAWIANPHQAMTTGFLRTVRNEYSEVGIQVLDVDNILDIDFKTLCNQLLRLEEWSVPSEDVLWTYEPEVYISKGRLLVPRIKHDSPRNDRMASGRRKIYSHVTTDSVPVSLHLPDKDLQVEFIRSGSSDVHAEHLTILARYSLVKAVRVGNLGHLHLILGSIKGTDRAVVALSHTNTSIVAIPPSLVFDLPETFQATPGLLPRVAASLLALWTLHIVSDMSAGASVVIFEPPMCSVAALGRAVANDRSIRMHIVSTQLEPTSLESIGLTWTQVHPRETVESLKELLPAHASVLYDLSNDSSLEPLSRRLVSHFPPSCLTLRLTHFFQDNSSPVAYHGHIAYEQTKLGAQNTLAALKDVASEPQQDMAAWESPVINASFLESLLQNDIDVLTVIDWKTDGTVPARLRPIDHGKLFTTDKTYLLVGLAGSTGRALARWMVTKGARSIVLSSRNPQNPDPKWIKEIERLGGHITVLPM